MDRVKINKRLQDYEKNKKLIDSNQLKFIPFYGFDRLQKYIPGIIPSLMYKVTSHMGVGKTKFAKFLFVYQTMLYAMKYGMNFKVLYFALEESEEEFLDDLMVHLVTRIERVQIDRFSLTGMSNTSLTREQLDAIKKVQNSVNAFMNNIEIIDDRYTPSSIFSVCKHYAKKWGTFAKNSDGEDDLSSYTPKDPNQIVLVVCDHISLLESEFDKSTNLYLTDHKTIAKWHTGYARRIIAKQWNWAVLNVQQQSLDSEKQQFTNRGDTIVSKILPTLDGLANNKEVGRDDYVAMGIFAPERYALEKYLDYEIKNNSEKSFNDRFRSLHLLKNRFGHPNKILPLYFDGRYTHFKELPSVTDPSINYFFNLLKR
jgi:hypothetical protein